MRGSPVNQMKYIFDASGIVQIGTSRHKEKDAARAAGARTAELIAKRTAITGISTHRAYFKRGVELMRFCRSVYKVRSFDKIQPEHVQGFLENKIRCDVSYRTFQQYAAALGKIETAINRTPNAEPVQWSASIKTARSVARDTLDKTIHPRAYERPDEITRQLTGDFQIVGALQHRAGLRVSEAAHIKSDQLKGVTEDPANGERVGRVAIKGKGGLVRVVLVPLDAYQRLEQRTAENGIFKIEPNQYRAALKEAAESCGQTYDRRSTHGLRWNFAQERMSTYSQAMSYEEALLRTSHDLGHKRPSITEHYLRR